MGYQESRHNTGLTLIEMIIVVSIIAGLIATASFGSIFLLATTNLHTSAHNISTALETARDYTLNHYNSNTNYGVAFTASSYTIYAGTTYSQSTSPVVQTTTLPAGITLSNINFNSQAYVYFQSITGLPSNTGSVQINSVRAHTIVSINGNGIPSFQ